MRTSTPLKAIGLVVLAASSFWATTSILGQGRVARMRSPVPRKAAQVAAPPLRGSTTALIGNKPENAPQPDDFERDVPGLVAGRDLRRFDVKVDGNRVHVFAKAAILEKRPGYAYLWALRVLDGANEERVLTDRTYAHQLFTVAGRSNPTFEETLELPPGQYQIGILLYEVPPKTNLARFQDEAFAQSQRTFAVAKPISILP